VAPAVFRSSDPNDSRENSPPQRSVLARSRSSARRNWLGEGTLSIDASPNRCEIPDELGSSQSSNIRYPSP